MANRSKKAPPAPPPPETEPVETEDPEAGDPDDPDAVDDDGGDGTEDTAPPADDGKGLLPDDDIPGVELDSQVRLHSPAASAAAAPRLQMDQPGFQPPNFIGIPPANPFATQQPRYTPEARAGDVYAGADPAGDAGDDMDDGPPGQPRRDGDPAREGAAATAGRETDILVNVFVDYEDVEHGGQMVACGHLQRITMSRAVQPETYIPGWVGGDTFWIRMYHATAITGQIGRPIGQPFAYRTGSPAPFVRGWRVDMDIDKIVNDRIAATLAAAGIAMPQGFVPGAFPGQPNQVPAQVFTGQMGQFQEIIDAQNKRIDAAEERNRRLEEERRLEQLVKPVNDAVARLEAKLEKLGSGTSTQDAVMLKVLDKALEQKNGSSEVLEFMKMTQGPDMVALVANVNAGIIDNLIKIKKLENEAGKTEGFDFKSVMGFVKDFQKDQREQEQKRREYIEKKEAEKEAKAEAAKKEKDKAAEVGKRTGRLIDGMLKGVVDAIRDRQAASDVAGRINLLAASIIQFGWADFDASTKELLEKLKNDPEKAVSEFAVYGGLREPSQQDAEYLGAIAHYFRQAAGMGPRKVEAKPAAPVTTAVPSVSASTPAADAGGKAPAAPSPSPAAKPEASTAPAPAPEKKPETKPAAK